MGLGKIAGAALGAALALGVAGGAKAAAIVTAAGDSFNLAFSGSLGGVNLSATGTLTVQSLSTSAMQVAVSLSNLTPAGSPNSNRITAFGFEIDPGTVSSATSNTASWGAEANSNISGGYTSIDVCAFDTKGCNNAAPGAEGIFEGTTESVLLSLTGNFTNPFTITDVVIKFASIGLSDASTTLVGSLTPPTSVPEPASLALFGMGLLGLGAVRRARRQG